MRNKIPKEPKARAKRIVEPNFKDAGKGSEELDEAVKQEVAKMVLEKMLERSIKTRMSRGNWFRNPKP